MPYIIEGLKRYCAHNATTGGSLYYATKQELHAAIGGMKHALFACSYWKNNKLYIGNNDHEYIDAIEYLDKAYKDATGIDFDDDNDMSLDEEL